MLPFFYTQSFWLCGELRIGVLILDFGQSCPSSDDNVGVAKKNRKKNGKILHTDVLVGEESLGGLVPWFQLRYVACQHKKITRSHLQLGFLKKNAFFLFCTKKVHEGLLVFYKKKNLKKKRHMPTMVKCSVFFFIFFPWYRRYHKNDGKKNNNKKAYERRKK